MGLITEKPFKTLREQENITTDMIVCGNCVYYEWSIDNDRHTGSCAQRENPRCDYLVMSVGGGDLHALCGAKMCRVFMHVDNIRLDAIKKVGIPV